MKVLTETLEAQGAAKLALQAALVAAGVAALTLAAKLRIPVDPVPVTMQTFAVLSIGAAYGLRLGVLTVAAYLAVGLLGADVFTGSEPGNLGWSYMSGTTGGYLVGFALAAGLLGMLARRGWDRNIVWMALAMVLGNALIYLPGLAWLAALRLESLGWDGVLYWGMGYFVTFDALKLALAALLFPTLWRLAGPAR